MARICWITWGKSVHTCCICANESGFCFAFFPLATQMFMLHVIVCCFLHEGLVNAR